MADKRNGAWSDSAGGERQLVLLRGSPPRERADAARNRAAVLDAATALFREHGVDAVSVDAIAQRAGVGKGTVFRRFGDKAGLAVALLDERERALQDAILSGPAPLGPGPRGAEPPPADRLRAFARAYLDYALDHLDLLRISETGSAGARYRIGSYRFWHRHVANQLAGVRREAKRGDSDPLAHAWLAPLAAEHLHAVAAELGPARVRRATLALLDAIA